MEKNNLTRTNVLLNNRRNIIDALKHNRYDMYCVIEDDYNDYKIGTDIIYSDNCPWTPKNINVEDLINCADTVLVMDEVDCVTCLYKINNAKALIKINVSEMSVLDLSWEDANGNKTSYSALTGIITV